MKLVSATSAETEEYMNPDQLAYFEARLRNLLSSMIEVCSSAKNELKESAVQAPDPYDAATAHAEINIELEELRRRRSQIALIEKALVRIKAGSYGYCEITGERIGLRRLELQPFATLSVEAQETLERAERGVDCHRFASMGAF